MVRAWILKVGTTVAAVAIGTTAALGVVQAGATPTPLHSKHDRLVTDDSWKMELDPLSW